MRKRSDFRMSKGDTESGSLVPVYLSAVILFVCVLAVVVDLGNMWFLSSSRSNDLALMRSDISQSGPTMVIENSSDPQKQIANHITDSLRKKGVDGELEIWAYESSFPKGDNFRIISWCVQVSENYETIMLGTLGVDSLPIRQDIAGSIAVISSTEISKAQNFPYGNGFFNVEAGAHSISFHSVGTASIDICPEKLITSQEETLKKIYRGEI